MLRSLAHIYSVAVVAINQVTTKFTPSNSNFSTAGSSAVNIHIGDEDLTSNESYINNTTFITSSGNNSSIVPALPPEWSTFPTTRVMLSWQGNTRTARVFKSDTMLSSGTSTIHGFGTETLVHENTLLRQKVSSHFRVCSLGIRDIIDPEGSSFVDSILQTLLSTSPAEDNAKTLHSNIDVVSGPTILPFAGNGDNVENSPKNEIELENGPERQLKNNTFVQYERALEIARTHAQEEAQEEKLAVTLQSRAKYYAQGELVLDEISAIQANNEGPSEARQEEGNDEIKAVRREYLYQLIQNDPFRYTTIGMSGNEEENSNNVDSPSLTETIVVDENSQPTAKKQKHESSQSSPISQLSQQSQQSSNENEKNSQTETKKENVETEESVGLNDDGDTVTSRNTLEEILDMLFFTLKSIH